MDGWRNDGSMGRGTKAKKKSVIDDRGTAGSRKMELKH